MKIFLIDDEEDCLVSLESAIEPAGYEVVSFPNPVDAVATFKEFPADIVITDMKMPLMTGIQVLQEIRKAKADARVIIITGYGDVDTAIAALNNGAYAFFGKPLDIGELLDTLEKINHEITLENQSTVQVQQLKNEYEKLKAAYAELNRMLDSAQAR